MIRAALLAAIAGTLLLFDRNIGLNWGLWITLVSAGIIAVRWMEHGRIGRMSLGLLVLAMLFAWGPLFTSNEPTIVLGMGACLAALSLAVLMPAEAPASEITVPRMVAAPIEVPARSVREAAVRLQDGVVSAKQGESLPVLRGVALTIPIVGIFGLALSNADPVFAAWRESAFAVLEDFPLGELVFGSILFVGCLGVFGLVARVQGAESGSMAGRWVPSLKLGSTERMIVLGSTAALFACFLALQLSYLFGNAPAEQGSGVTFAEYARRGFFELVFVATACGAMIALVRGDEGKPGDLRVVRLLELTVIAQVVLMLVSAFRKMLLYEAAYGYTMSRIWVQGFMAVLAFSLCALALEVYGNFDTHRLVRRMAAAGAAMLVTLTHWNDDAWIVSRNLERYRETGRFDYEYVAYQLSPDAIPAALKAARAMGGTRGWCLDRMVRLRWHDRLSKPDSWYELNLSRARAASLLTPPTDIIDGPRRTELLRKRCDVAHRGRA
jgi:hypothetical protein